MTLVKVVLALVILLFSSSCASNFVKKNELQVIEIGRAKTDEQLVEDLGKAFRQLNKANKCGLNITNSDKALGALLNGSLDIFIGTIDIPGNQQNNIGKILLARDGLVFVTNPANPVNNLSKDQLMDIFSGATTNWKDLGGSNKPIVIVEQASDSVEKKTIYGFLFGSMVVTPQEAITVSKVEELKEAVSKFPNALAYISYSNLNNLNKGLKALNLDNIPANDLNIRKGYFPLVRPTYLYFHHHLLKDSGKDKTLKQFVNFIYSSKGQAIIQKHGLITLTEGELELIILESEPIYIGVAAPLDGVYMDLGRSMVNAAKIGVDEKNQQGGINGRAVELIICNDKDNINVALQCANKFVKSNVIGVVGHLTSQASIEASKIYVQNKIVQITPASTHPWFTERPGSKGYVFRTTGRDDKQAKLIAETIKNLNKQHPLKVSILNNGTIYGSTLSTLVENEILKLGLDEVVEIKFFEQQQAQYHKEISAISSNVLVFIGEYGDAARVVKELALNNKTEVTFIGADGTFSRRFIEEAGLRAEGAYITGQIVDKDSPEVNLFLKNYKERFKTDAAAYATTSYDAINILFKAVEQSKNYDKDEIAHNVQNIKYQGLTGLIYFDNIGDPVLPRMSTYKVVKGQFVRLTPDFN